MPEVKLNVAMTVVLDIDEAADLAEVIGELSCVLTRGVKARVVSSSVEQYEVERPAAVVRLMVIASPDIGELSQQHLAISARSKPVAIKQPNGFVKEFYFDVPTREANEIAALLRLVDSVYGVTGDYQNL